MSLQTDLFTLLTATFSTRFYPGVAPAGTPTPYGTYTRVRAVEQTTLDTNGGTGNESNTRMQINVWSLTYLEASTKAEAVKTALKGWANANVVLSEQDIYEPDTLKYGVLLDVSIWHQ